VHRKNAAWKPTPYFPGTQEKIRVLTERAEKRLPLFHPEDSLPLDKNGIHSMVERYLKSLEDSDDDK